MVKFKEWLNTYDELHACVIGIGQGFFFWQKHLPLTKKMENERHYYEQGKIVGIVLVALFLIGFIKLIQCVII